jgi:hypothetical protein
MIYRDILDEDELKAYVRSLNSRAQALDLPGRVTGVQLRDCILSSGGRCAWCAVRVVGVDFEIDHIISLRSGGTHERDNLTVSCPACNRRKATLHPARFAQETYTQLGQMTPLLRQLFDHYDITPMHQKRLFDDDDTESSSVYRW